MRGIERRWRMVPLFLRPQHVVERDLATRLNLYDNLHNAVTAFIFGARKAALALCRATLEAILLDFYVPDLSARPPRLDKPERPARRLGLDEIVNAACREHELIRANKDRIFNFKNLADTALHRRETNSAGDMAREKETARFMELLAVLIQSAPERPEGIQS